MTRFSMALVLSCPVLSCLAAAQRGEEGCALALFTREATA
jgi:hypothetical protein